jgi:hypothetical protein
MISTHLYVVCVCANDYTFSHVFMCRPTNNYIIKLPSKDEQNDMTVIVLCMAESNQLASTIKVLSNQRGMR